MIICPHPSTPPSLPPSICERERGETEKEKADIKMER